ncbi:MAG: hypothetical protein LBI06_00370, partial [Treponema sp.]|nr:hypothetical protein [Treponema sp.]
MKKFVFFLMTAIAVLALCSCLGVQADISIRADGSGRIALEYRVSQMLESIGRLDGNERWPAVPVGRADFERSIARIPGLRLVSFRTSDVKSTGDLVTKAELQFKDIATLVAFLDSTGKRASYSGNQTSNVLRLTLTEP